MSAFATKLIGTAAIAALICATPISVDLVRSAAGGTQVALTFDAAQARDLGGRGMAARSPGFRSAGDLRANDVRASNVQANNVRLNNSGPTTST